MGTNPGVLRGPASPKNSENDDEFHTTTLKGLRSTIKDTLKEYGKHDIFFTKFKLLAILYTFPINVTTTDRNFSTLSRLRCDFAQGFRRLTLLCLLNVHQNKNINVHLTIDRFIKNCIGFVF